MDDAVDTAIPSDGVFDDHGHIGQVADIGRMRMDDGAKRFELLNGANATGQFVLRRVALEIAIPDIALGHVAPGGQDQPAFLRRQRLGNRQPDAAKSTSDQVCPTGPDGLVIGGFQCRIVKRLFIATPGSEHGVHRGGIGDHLFDDLVGQFLPRAARIFFIGDPPEQGLCRFDGKNQIDRGHGKPGHLARDHANRSGDDRLFRRNQFFISERGRAVREHGDLCWFRQCVVGNRLSDEHQRIEAVLLHAVKEAGPGAMTGVLGDAPEMRDAAGYQTTGHHIAEEQIIPFAAPFGGQHVGGIIKPRKTVSRPDLDNGMASGAQAFCGG